MAKKGFFSWFRKDKTKEQEKVTTDNAQEQIDTSSTEQTEAELAAQQLAEQQRVEEQNRLAAEKEAAEKAEAELQAQQLAEQQRVEEQNRLAAEKEAAEKAEAELQAQQLAEQQRVEEQNRLAVEKEAAEKAEAELQAQQLAEQQRVEEQNRLAVEKEAAEKAEADRLAQELAEQQLAEQQRAEEQARIEAEQKAAEQAAVELAAQEKAAADKAEADRQAEQQRVTEQTRLAEEQLAQEQRELEEAERAEARRLEEEEAAAQAAQEAETTDVVAEPQAKPVKEGLFARLKRGLKRTSENIGSGFMGIFSGKKIDDDLFEELEEQLLIADVGVETTTRLIDSLTDSASRKQLKDAEALYDLMRDEMQTILDPVAIPLVPENANGPFVILMVGVNGVGKTTTIGKLAKQYQKQGKSVMLAAGDTFRAAAVEQLQVWGQRNEIPVVAQHTGADSASVLFDALQAAKARNVDVLIADTAGRLQNKSHLMEELKKVVRVMKKLDPDAPHEVMLTLDASTGQNAISQAQLFQEAVGVTGITISKLDGTAKGGVIFAIADKFNIPIRHIGVGEQIDDLRTFNSNDFIEALFSQDKAE
ncbi:signal recognition particle-docking protein FtsY [Shewanella sp. 10N.286.51.B7]|uniref:signal recognition particle-docking protein FtsY n=1 Tax=Shewanella sp. 10N.286.51.B7 TaxID=1880836 RepID=UPI000C85E716|nr:signal recognition particle-docking protein FtsY [Shewanella sp. 10N.286.51.B7]PMG78938.1 signal recognition particle-docking protein FtsY [Shewanella sp. 10N.286.51.B7]